MRCPNCGADTDAGRGYCVACGAVLSSAQVRSMEYDEDEQSFFQPIWNTYSGRRIAAIIAWIAMILITVAAFLPDYGKTGNFLTDLAEKGANILGNALGIDAGASAATSFTLFDVCRDNLVLLILFIIALVIGYLLPLLTETPFELIPFGLLAGINIYTCVNANKIIVKMNMTSEEAVSELTGGVQEIMSALGLGSVRLTTAGCILSYLGIVLLLIAVILHFVLKPKEKNVSIIDDFSTDNHPYSEDEYGATGVLSGNPGMKEENELVPPTTMLDGKENAESGTVVLHQPVGTICRLNSNEKKTIYNGELTLGRDASRVGFVIRSNSVSGVHAKIIAENGTCGIVDLHSTNGTYINDQKLAPDIKVNLRDGDYISLGAEIMQYHKN